ncbi:Solute carrier family 25 member 45 [Manis javanica]|nr:Solute carrier family 25 member 45 [Manis javanica]
MLCTPPPACQGLPGALGLVLGHPFDTLKVRLQTQTSYRGIVDCVVRTYRHESLLGFFKGMSFPIVSRAVVNSIVFGVYSNTLLALTATSHQERRAQPPSCMHVFIAGCTGGFLQAYCLAPFDLIKVQLQNGRSHGCNRGAPHPDGQNPSSGTVLVAGGFVGIASWAVATPLDVIKSRMQMARLKQREYRGVLDFVLTHGSLPTPPSGLRPP